MTNVEEILTRLHSLPPLKRYVKAYAMLRIYLLEEQLREMKGADAYRKNEFIRFLTNKKGGAQELTNSITAQYESDEEKKEIQNVCDNVVDSILGPSSKDDVMQIEIDRVIDELDALRAFVQDSEETEE